MNDLFHSALNRVVSAAEKRMTAHGITKPGLAKVSGAHLSEAPNSPEFNRIEAEANADARAIVGGFTEEQLLAGDRARNDAKATAHQREDRRALDMQMDAQARADWRAR